MRAEVRAAEMENVIREGDLRSGRPENCLTEYASELLFTASHPQPRMNMAKYR